MLDIGGGELLVIGIVALVVIGPKELPGLLRTAGNAMNKVRRMAAEFRGQFDEAMREAELDQAKKAFNDVNEAAASATTTFNPIETIRNEIKSVRDEIRSPAPDAAIVDKVDAGVAQPVQPPEPEQIAAPAPEPVVETPPEAKPKRARRKAADDTTGTAA